MKKDIAMTLIMILVILDSATGLSAKDNNWEEIGRGYLNLNAILIDKNSPDIIYIGSNNTVSKSEDNAHTWRNILSVRGQNSTVNFLLSDPGDANSIYAASGSGLFCSNNQGKYWRRIFQGRNYLESDCTAITVFGSDVYLGTKAGLFVSKDKGRSWQRIGGILGKSRILAIAINKNAPEIVYVACNEGVFKTQDKGESWVKIFTANLTENNPDREVTTEEQREISASDLRYILVDPDNLDYLYLATSRGIYKSKDQGKTWEAFTGYGLLSQDVKSIILSEESRFYALTKSAIYEYKNERWQEISLGLPSTDIRFIALDKRYNLYAACDKGLFKASETDANGPDNDLISLYLKNEPDIRKIQEAAVEYAEVNPDKIKSWRKQAARKAILPQVNVGVNRDITDLWHWEGGSTTKSDDDTLRKGRDALGWDVSLTWDLSELIWNEDQTSIDSRSKLMAELRDNILDEVTRIYFERLRLKMELDNLNIEDRKKRLEKELRLKELASSLDALTGGYFSQCSLNPNPL